MPSEEEIKQAEKHLEHLKQRKNEEVQREKEERKKKIDQGKL